MTEAEKDGLILDNTRLVATLANDLRDRGVEYEELISEGTLGLVEAAESFDPNLGKFSDHATAKIRLRLFHRVGAEQQENFLKDGESSLHPRGGYSIEKIYDFDAWGEYGNAAAICERWSKLDASPEDLSVLYEDIRDKRAKFTAAFMSLTGAQRKLVTWVYLGEPRTPITQAARDLGISYFQATRMLKRALKTMREVITRMESKKGSGGKIASGRASLTSGLGYVLGSNAA